MSRKRLLIALFVLLMTALLTAALTAQEETDHPPITAENASELTELYRFGRGDINAWANSPDGTILAIGSAMGVWLYDTRNPDLLTDPPLLPAQDGIQDRYMPVAFNADGTLLAMGSRRHVTVWDVATREIVRTVNSPEDVRAVAFTPDETGFIIADRGGDLIQVDFETWTVDDETVTLEDAPELEQISVQRQAIDRMDYNPDRTLLATIGVNQPVVVVDAETLEVVFTSPQARVNDFEFNPDDGTLAIFENSQDVYLYDTETWELIWQVTPSTPLGNEAGVFSPSGDVLWILDATNSISIHSAATGEEQRVIELDPDRELPLGIVIDMMFLPSETQLVMVQERGGNADEIMLVDLGPGTVESITGAHMTTMNGVAFNPAMDQLIFNDADNIYVWSIGADTTLDNLPRIGERFRSIDNSQDAVAYTPDGSTIIQLGREEVVAFDAETLEPRFTAPLVEMSDAALFADGALLVVVGGRGVTTFDNLLFGGVLDMATGEILFTFGDDTFGAEPNSVSVSADGSLIAILSEDGSVRVFGIPQ